MILKVSIILHRYVTLMPLRIISFSVWHTEKQPEAIKIVSLWQIAKKKTTKESTK